MCLQDAINRLSDDGVMQRFIPIILRKSFNGVGNPIPKEMSVKPMWDNTARVIHSLGFNNYKLSHDASSLSLLIAFLITRGCTEPNNETAIFSQYVLPLPTLSNSY
jgi:hypothetical protein